MRIAILASIFALMILLALPGVVSAAELSVSGEIVKPDLVVTTIAPNAGAGGFMFANEPNVISVTVKNQGTAEAGPSTLSVIVVGSGIYFTSVGTLAVDASSTVTVNDPVSRPFGTPLTITATADSGGVIDEGNEENNQTISIQPVFFNGFKGKRWTGGGDLNTAGPNPFNGRFNVILSAGNTAANGPLWITKTYSWSASDLPIPAGATVTRAQLYQGYYNNQMPGLFPTYTMSFNGITVPLWKTYHDRKNFGTGDNPSGLYVYDVTNQFNTDGNTITITPEAGNTYGIFGAYLVVVYQDPGTTVKKIWINDNFDILYAKSTHSVSSDEATAYAPFAGVDTTNMEGALAIAILSNADEAGRSKFFFNSNEYTGFSSDYLAGPQIGFSVYDVTSAVASGNNEARLQSYDPGSDGDNMNAMNTILVVEKTEGPVDAQFSATPLSGDKDLTVTFTDESTGYITSRTWSFGDGTFSNEISPSHTYTTRGTKTVSLKVNGVGALNTDTETKTDYITVKEPAPVIDFTGTPTSGPRHLTVTFTPTNTGGQVDLLAWDFGDGAGAVSTSLTPQIHVYENEGTYKVCLTAIGPDYTVTKIRDNYINVGAATIDIILNPASINFGTMAAGVDETGSTQVAVTTTGGPGWDVNAAASNGGYMKAGPTLQLANPFQMANGAGLFHDMTTPFAVFMTGTPDEDRTDTANVKQPIAAADGPGAYAITLTFTYSFH